MIEMLGVLAIIGVLSAGGIMGYSAAMENYKVNETINDIETIITNIDNLITNPSKRGSANLYADQLLALGVIPKRYASSLSRKQCAGTYGSSPCLKSLFNEDFFIRNMRADSSRIPTLYSGKGKQIVPTNRAGYLTNIQFTKIPKSVCVKIARHSWGSHIVSINNADPVFFLAPLSSAEADVLCSKDKGGTLGLYIQLVFWSNMARISS